MATSAVNSVFLDTNVLVYATVSSAPLHTVTLTRLQELWASEQSLWVSRQVLREYLAVLTRPQTFSHPQPAAIVAERVRFFMTHFHVADENDTVTKNLLSLLTALDIKGKQIHDANIIATMQAYGLTHLLTHNANNFRRFAHLVTVIPLL